MRKGLLITTKRTKGETRASYFSKKFKEIMAAVAVAFLTNRNINNILRDINTLIPDEFRQHAPRIIRKVDTPPSLLFEIVREMLGDIEEASQ